MKEKSTFEKVDNGVCKVLRTVAWISAICLVAIMLVAFFNVVGEKLRKVGLPVTGIPASTEIIKYLHVPLVFLAASYVTVERGHTTIDLLSSKFPAIMQKICNIIGDLLAIGVCSLIAWRGWIQMGKFITRHTMSSVSGVGFALWPFALIMVIGFVLMAVSFLWAIVREIVGYKPAPPADPSAEDAPELEEKEEGGEA